MKVYGLGGLNYHEALSSTTQTIDGASQTIEYQTQGWGWLFGAAASTRGSRRGLRFTSKAGFADVKGKPIAADSWRSTTL